MHPRLNFFKAAPDAFKAVMDIETYVQNSGLERRFIHLIKLRASIINGCAYCVDMHIKESRHDGLPEQWINLMSVWQESPVYDEKERALLAWVDAVTKVAETGIPDSAYEPLKAHFSEEEITK
ncbi:MAG TPA: carboxymuconolactone decarboxylase family protein, partial [Pseudorhizobium sp.]|nr:carboxymuconolactone decarboxylase family protein [Pseudorhizobium sp.]